MKTIVDYASKVKEQHALNKTLAPVETDLTDASRAYAIGEQFIYDGDLFKAKTAIAQHDALVLNTNYEAADDITTQIKNKTVTTDSVPTEGSTNPVQSNGVFVENRNIYKVMGALGAKNYLQILASGTTTTNGVTFVVNDDGTITVSTDENGATADTNYYLNPASQIWVDPDYPIGNYILSGCPAGGSAGTYRLALSRQGASSVLDTGTGATFTHASGVKVLALIQIGTGTVLTTPIVFKPMIRLATDTDNTFQPYAKTNQQLTAENEALTNKLNNEIVTRSALGAKNILPFDLAEIKALNTNGTWAGNVYTYRGVAFTVNSDGTISATGTATGGNASIKLFAASSNYEMLGKEVILTGCPSNGSASSYRIQAYRMASADGSTGTYFDDGAGTDAFTVLNDASGTVGSFAVAVYENATVTNLLFKPMVRLASDPDTTYQPYAKTNRELTAENQTLTNQVTGISDNVSDISDEIADMNNVLGAKNLLPITALTVTKNGITFTVNSDGSVNVDGTATAEVFLTLNNYTKLKLLGNYILNGCPANGSNTTYLLYAHERNASDTAFNNPFKDFGNGVDAQFTTGNGVEVVILIRNGQTINNLTFKPMIRPANIKDSTYVPYALTNRELTEDISDLSAYEHDVTVTADGTKSVTTLVAEAMTVLNTFMNSLDSNARVIGISITPATYGLFKILGGVVSGGSDYGAIRAFRCDNITNGLSFSNMVVLGTTKLFSKIEVTSAGTTYTNLATEVPTEGQTVIIKVMVFPNGYRT